MPATKLPADGSSEQDDYVPIQRQNADEIDLKAYLTDTRFTNARNPNTGSVVNASLSGTGLTFIPYYLDVTAIGTARPVWAGKVVWTVYYTPFAKPTNALVADHVINAT